MIEYRNIKKLYNGKPVVSDLNLRINDGEFVVLIGPSGCGKTTTLKMLNRLIKSDGGSIIIDGNTIESMDLTELRTSIGYVIQQIGLFPNMNVEQNISVVLNLLKWKKDRIKERVKELLELVKMPYEEYAHKYPNQLSGGQQQRIGVLRALAANPPIILMDEPFGALDPVTRDALQDEVKAIQEKLNVTIVFVTHDMDEAIKMADVIVFMDQGKIVQQASPEEMLRNPAAAIVKQFMGKQHSNGTVQMLCQDLIKTSVFKLNQRRQIAESLNLMRNRDLNSALVIDKDQKYQGVIWLKDLVRPHHGTTTISELIKTNVPIFDVLDDGQQAITEITENNHDFVVVLSQSQEIAGIITKGSIVRSLSEVVWGDSDD